MTGPTWTILVPTLGQRAPLFRRLMDVLLPQLEPYGGRARVAGWWNNGEPTIADIRQDLVRSVTTDYLSFVDDDDLVPEYFVAEVMTALESRPDYVGWVTHYTANGRDHGVVYHSLEHGGWREERNPYRLLRDITHINPMRSIIAKQADFRAGFRAGRPEDRPWVDQLRGKLVSEVYIDKIMYEYLWRQDTSAWRKPHLIDKRPGRRPHISSPYFTWHPRSAGVATTSNGETVPELLIIIPTRGRPENMTRVIEAWKATNAFEVANLLFAVDSDDPELGRYMQVQDSHLTEDLGNLVTVTVAERVPMAPRTNAEAARFADQFYALGSAGDDHVPETDGWAQTYLAELKALGSGIVYGDDGFQHASLCTEWVMTSDIVRALGGRLVPAPVDHLYADNSVMELGKATGLIRYVGHVKMTHYNPYAGKAVRKDEGYERVNSRERYAEDGASFKQWRRVGLPADVEAVRALNPLVTAPPASVRALPDRRMPPRHRTRLGLDAAGAIQSKPSTSRLDPRSRKGRPAMRIPRRIRDIRGLTSQEALLTLADMALQVPRGEAIVELGVYQGQSLLTLAWGSSQGASAHVYGIDPWELAEEPSEDIGYLGKQFPAFTHDGNRRWTQWHVRSLGYSNLITVIAGFSHLEGQAWQGPPVGLLYVDGDHRYEAVIRDALTWAEQMAEGGRIVFDDYVSSQPDVIRAVEELVQAGILEPVQIHADRLADTRLTAGWAEARDRYVDEATAQALRAPQVTSTVDSRVGEEVQLPLEDPEQDRRPGDGENDPAWDGVAEAPEELEELPVRSTEQERLVVQEAELDGVAAGTSIEDLNTVQLRALAKARGIKLGTRKDKRDAMLQALREGE